MPIIKEKVERNKAMKKFKTISILMILAMLLSMTACGGEQKTEPVPEPETESTAATTTVSEEESTSETTASDESEVSADFKATMDSYEEFFDEYVDFMQRYKENPTDTELLMEMSDMMTKEADMLRKLEAMDQSTMTTAEAAYYLEVTARINQKLASVM